MKDAFERPKTVSPVANKRDMRQADPCAITIRGIPEPTGEPNLIAQMNADKKNAVIQMFVHIGVECGITDVQRLGSMRKEGTKVWPLLVRLDNAWNMRKVLASLPKLLRNFTDFRAYVGPDLSADEVEKENDCLRRMWELINKSGVDRKNLGFRNCTLQGFNEESNKWEDKWLGKPPNTMFNRIKKTNAPVSSSTKELTKNIRKQAKYRTATKFMLHKLLLMFYLTNIHDNSPVLTKSSPDLFFDC